MRIVILEDNEDRRKAMEKVVAARFKDLMPEFFVSAWDFIAHLEATGLDDVALISLDHDLEMIAEPDGSLTDPGDGVDAAEWLAARPPSAPLIVHTTNQFGGDKMMDLLESAGWRAGRVFPYGGVSWIRELWRVTVRDLLHSR